MVIGHQVLQSCIADDRTAGARPGSIEQEMAKSRAGMCLNHGMRHQWLVVVFFEERIDAEQAVETVREAELLRHAVQGSARANNVDLIAGRHRPLAILGKTVDRNVGVLADHHQPAAAIHEADDGIDFFGSVESRGDLED